MKHAELTTEIADKYLSAFQKAWQKHSNSVGYSFFGPTAEGKTEACYAPPANKLNSECDQDYFGLLYQGWSGKPMIQGMGKEAVLWMEYLVDPEGPFKEILPFLYHKTAEEICDDNGILYYNLVDCNIALLWTFAQATRYMYENPGRMERFQYLVAKFPKDKAMVLFCTFVLGPVGDDITDTLWARSVIAHGEPLGNMGIKRAHAFLNGIVSKTDVTGTSLSCQCFGGTIAYDYRTGGIGPQQGLDDYVKSFETERKKDELNAASIVATVKRKIARAA